MKFLICLISILLCSLKATACSCLPLTHRFLQHVEGYDFVGLVEVVRKDTIYHEDDKRIWYAFTIVRVIEQYHGEPVGDEVKIVDAKGFECFTRLHYRRPGDRRIVKGFLKPLSEYMYNYLASNPLPPTDWGERCLELFLCDVNQLRVVDDNVHGVISCHLRTVWVGLRKFGDHVTFGLFANKTRGRRLWQSMPLKRFERKIRKRVSA